jgi:hypothetical protein
VPGPWLTARIEKWRDMTGLGIYPSEIAPLVKIALGACQRQIIKLVGSAMFARDDVINLQGNQGRVCLTALTILTTIISTLAHRGSECGVHRYAPSAVTLNRASACNTAKRLLASM